MLVSLREGSRMDDLLDEQPLWSVSVLSESQRHIAGRFSMKGRISDRLLFEDIPYVRASTAAPPWSAAPSPPWSAAPSRGCRPATTPW